MNLKIYYNTANHKKNKDPKIFHILEVELPNNFHEIKKIILEKKVVKINKEVLME